jgi:hypothetical protein
MLRILRNKLAKSTLQKVLSCKTSFAYRLEGTYMQKQNRKLRIVLMPLLVICWFFGWCLSSIEINDRPRKMQTRMKLH